MQQTAGMGLVISGPEIRVCRAPPEGGEPPEGLCGILIHGAQKQWAASDGAETNSNSAYKREGCGLFSLRET